MYLLTIVTVPNQEIANKISKILVENRVASCVNKVSNVESIYWWEGKIESSNEIILLIKTTDNKYSDLEELIKKNHPYDVPEIICFEIKKGLNTYLSWIGNETNSLP